MRLGRKSREQGAEDEGENVKRKATGREGGRRRG